MRVPRAPWRIRLPRVNDVWAQRVLWWNAYFWMGLVVLKVYQLRHGVNHDPKLIFDPAKKMRTEREQMQRDHDVIHMKP